MKKGTNCKARNGHMFEGEGALLTKEKGALFRSKKGHFGVPEKVGGGHWFPLPGAPPLSLTYMPLFSKIFFFIVLLMR